MLFPVALFTRIEICGIINIRIRFALNETLITSSILHFISRLQGKQINCIGGQPYESKDTEELRSGI